jgi:endonuclease/exonuclease/phosphatase family metal-dependent hydrolase
MRTIRVVTWNIRKGKGDGRHRPDLAEIGQALAELGADIVFCQEVFHDWRTVDQTAHISDLLSARFRYGANAVYRRGHHGNATFSRWPILWSENRDLSTNRIERRGCLYTRVHDEDGVPLHLLNVHLGLSHRQRRVQSERVISWVTEMVRPGEPVIWAGDFNDWNGRLDMEIGRRLPVSNAMLALSAAARRTFSTRRPLFSLDRIYYKDLRLLEIRVLKSAPFDRLSDHYPVLAMLGRDAETPGRDGGQPAGAERVAAPRARP